MGFSLDDWVEVYIRKYSPIVWSRRASEDRPAWEVYMGVMEILNMEKDDPRVRDLVAKYRKQVLGDSCLKSAPSEYWEIELMCDIGISPGEWRKWAIPDQAKVMARHYLANMVAVIDSHYRATDDNQKKLHDQTKN